MNAPTPGRFVWHELHTSDRRRALTFYCTLMGWATREIALGSGDAYGLCSLDGKEHAGVILSRAPSGTPPRWLPYLAVDDVDETVLRAEGLGGRTVGSPADVPNVGRIALLADPQGAVFAIHKPAGPLPRETTHPPLGGFCWEDLMSTDAADAARFYAALFGYGIETLPLGEMGTYRILRRGPRDTAGILQLPAGATTGSHWLTYLHVKDVGRTARNAREIGATTLVPPRELPGVGRFVVLADPTGAAFALFTPT